MPISWGVKPPPRLPKAWIRLTVVRAGQEVEARILGPALGVECHHHEGRSVACLGHECPEEIHSLFLEWKGFLPAAMLKPLSVSTTASWRETVLCITPGIAEDVAAFPVGTLIVVSRPGKKKNGELRVEAARRQPLDTPLAAFNVIPYVLRAMGMSLHHACKLARTG